MKQEDYLKEFSTKADDWFKECDFLERNYTFITNFFKRDNLEKIEWSDVQSLGNYLHAFANFALAKKKALGNSNHSIQHYRDSFIYLAYGSEVISERLNNLTEDDDYRIRNFGESIIGELTGYVFANDFVLYNKRDKHALKLLNIDPGFERGDGLGDHFVKFNKAIQPVIESYKEIVGPRTNFPINLEIDQFFSYLFENYDIEITEQHDNDDNIYWLIAPGKSAKFWEEWKEEEFVSIGWDYLGDLSQYGDKEEIRKRMQEHEQIEGSKKNDTHACWEFANDIKVGDTIIAKTGSRKILGLGTVESDYYYDESRDEHKNIRKVKWLKIGEWFRKDEEESFVTKTLTNITPYKNLTKEILGIINRKDKESSPKNYWWLNANVKYWDISETPIGEEQSYTTHSDSGNKRRVYDYFGQVHPGDYVVGYQTSPTKAICALYQFTKGVHEDKDGNEVVTFIKLEQFSETIELDEIRPYAEFNDFEFFKQPQGSLFKLTENQFNLISKLLREKNPESLIPSEPQLVPFTIQDALKDLFLSEDGLVDIIKSLSYKKNIILEGPPGVGKTFIAKRIAYTMMGFKDDSKIEMIQFHQSYSYEDFIQGIRPDGDKFVVKNGIFYDFCKKVQNDLTNDYFFIIDEINRGNLSKIFGELMMLIESDKRGHEFSIPLTYSQKENNRFFIPDNVHLIGTMNTADRSLSIVDFALRRRFRFIKLNPNFNDKLKEYLSSFMDPKLIDDIIYKLNGLNQTIVADKNLGVGFAVGHSYFCNGSSIDLFENQNDWYKQIITNEIGPLLEEYWFDNLDKARTEIEKLLSL